MKLALSGLVLLDASLRHTTDALANAPAQHPQTEVPMEIGLLKGDQPNTYAVTLRVRLDSAYYALSVGYAALLTVDPEGAETPPDFDNRIMATGAAIAFPYCRELVSNLTSRSRFGVIWLTPTNFGDVVARQTADKAAVQ